ncbi:hypothetical protein K493DRAFT_314945 [Basidiobolus meristosporus CBS 931.73]|uniref:Uncharacterized protein n=1 Tax=Basidiobolus meristosporus CBS 931.73 TaxID=1314790 RepID=A0A1Y1YC12_9FUNG|nr:hypothetical protein K493DRAFT_314945 [Basidiobolus meristosporus CBS 931.73]|eukprot:ORX95581.1 hypothetical protein K493DRAFT_314945 [Basidiobolus meristosporus CBS 931.73]
MGNRAFDACYNPEEINVFVSFNFVTFISYLLVVVVGGTQVFLYLSKKYQWERQDKSPVGFLQDIQDALIYNVVLFLFGNYSHTFSIWTVLAFFAGLIGFALLGELPFLKVSLVTWRTWSREAWMVHIGGVGIVFILAIYHFVQAYYAGILSLYFTGLLVGLGLMVAGPAVNWYEEYRRREIAYVTPTIDPPTQSDKQEVAKPTNGVSLRVTEKEIARVKSWPKYRVHLHHWQIFYLLAFFTRFPSVLGQICSGLVLGIFMHGGSAYGFDPLLEQEGVSY